MQLLENLNYMWLTFVACVIFGQCWLRSRRKISHIIIITTTYNHQLLSTYSARCCRTLILSITTVLYNGLYFLYFYRWGFRAYAALNHKASSVQCRNDWIYICLIPKPERFLLYQGQCGTGGPQGEKRFFMSKGSIALPQQDTLQDV